MCGKRESKGSRRVHWEGNIEYNRASLTIVKVDGLKRDQQMHWDYAVKRTREEVIRYQP